MEIVVVTESRTASAHLYELEEGVDADTLWGIVRSFAERSGHPPALVETALLPGVSAERTVEVVVDGVRVFGDPLRPNIITLGARQAKAAAPRGGWFMYAASEVEESDPVSDAVTLLEDTLDELPARHAARARLRRAIEVLIAGDEGR